jgi:hypothetical protein
VNEATQDLKRLITPRPGPNVIKLFTSVIYECLSQASVFVLLRPFRASLMFVSKAGAYPCEAPFRCSTLG